MPPSEKDNDNMQPISGIDRTIHEPARFMIMAYLYVVESADFLFIMRHTKLTRGNLSSHMSKLETAGYVEIKKEFVEKIPRTLLRLTAGGRKAFQEYRNNMRQILEDLPE